MDNKLFKSKEIITLTIELHHSNPKIGTYNMSCGPKGLFIIDKNENLIDSIVKELVFESIIQKAQYSKINESLVIPIVPEPKEICFLNDNFIDCKNNFFIEDSELLEICTFLKTTCDRLAINFTSTNGIKVKCIKKNFKKDQYKLIISDQTILIHAADYGGKLYAFISLLHLINYYHNKIPQIEITDSPKFKWRGMHLDCARQFHSVAQIKRLLLYMAMFKLNRFHWHLTDNEAWRLDVPNFPELASKSSFRGYHEIIPPLYGSGFLRYGGFYSSSDVNEVVLYAKKLNIEVMPEIELPSHAWALVQVMPELRDQFSNKISEDVGNYSNNVINPSLTVTWNFLEKILSDISKMFPYSIIHVGLDERPKTAWEGSPEMMKFMKQNNYHSFGEVQDFYMNKVIELLKKNNKRTAAWNEAALPPYKDIGSGGGEGNIDKNCLIFAWEHPSVAEQAVKKGFETVMCPAQKTYFDMAYNNSTQERGLCWASTIEASEVYNWKPLQGIDKKTHSLIIGIQGHLWSETITKKRLY